MPLLDIHQMTEEDVKTHFITMEQLIKGNSRVRNVAIGAAFQYMHIIEKWGTGIPRIFNEAKEYGLKEPEMKDFGTSFRISIYRKDAETDVYGVVGSATEKEAEKDSSASKEAQLEAEDHSSASNDAQLNSSASIGIREEVLLSRLSEPIRTRGKIILEAIIRDSHTTASRIGQENGISRATIQRTIDEMKKAKIVSHRGSNNGGSWVIHWE